MPHKNILHMLLVLSPQLHALDGQYHLQSIVRVQLVLCIRLWQGYGANACSGTTTVWASRGTRLLLLTCMCIVLLLTCMCIVLLLLLLSKRTLRWLCICVTHASHAFLMYLQAASQGHRGAQFTIGFMCVPSACVTCRLNIFPSSLAGQVTVNAHVSHQV